MKNCWMNIGVDNSIEVSEEKFISKSLLLNMFETLFLNSQWSFVKWNDTKSAPFQCIISNDSKYVKVLVYLKQISNAGWEEKPHIKRVQVSNPKKLNLDFFRYDDVDKISLILGYYNYTKPLLVSWDPNEYRRHNTNRSCYVEIDALLDGYNLDYCKKVSMGQSITLFKPEKFGMFLDNHFESVTKEINNLAEQLYDISMDYYKLITQFDAYWDGKEKVMEMKTEGGRNWRQLEWPGFYFEHIMEKVVDKGKFFTVGYDNMKFDMFDFIPWDLKVHSSNSTSKDKIITNELLSIRKSIDDYGKQGFIILEGESIYEEDSEFRIWHDKEKGKPSNYQIKNQLDNKKHRRRKKAFKPTRLLTLIFDESDLDKHPQFQQGFINSNGKKRNAKFVIDLTKLESKNILLEKNLKV